MIIMDRIELNPRVCAMESTILKNAWILFQSKLLKLLKLYWLTMDHQMGQLNAWKVRNGNCSNFTGKCKSF